MSLRKLLSTNVCGRIAIRELAANRLKNSQNTLNPVHILNRCSNLEAANIFLFQRYCRHYCTLKENKTSTTKSNDTSIAMKIAELLNCSLQMANTIVKNTPDLLSKPEYLAKINILKDNCLSAAIIKRNPWLLSLSEGNLYNLLLSKYRCPSSISFFSRHLENGFPNDERIEIAFWEALLVISSA